MIALCGRTLLGLLVLGNASTHLRAEVMLELFNVNWDELIRKMPEIAEAGYTSLWLPPPAKAGSVFSVGYDPFDPFDLGDKYQRGTVRTRYGTKAELQQVVETAHRFGLRVYLDNITNHRGFDIPGYNANTPTNLYPGMVPGDFHLHTVGAYFSGWPSISDWSNVWELQHQPLGGLIDIANESGPLNENFGNVLGATILKPVFVRHPGAYSYYMDTNLPAIAGPWHPFNGTNGDPVAEDVNAYLIRAALWTLNETKCDGFRLDAVKHVPETFFGDATATLNGYCGAIQAMYDFVHGYGNNVTENGYVELDDNRNSCFDTETARNDAMIFGEHLGEPPGFQGYLDRGMRLLNAPYHFQLNNILGNPAASLAGLEQRDYVPGSGFSGAASVLYSQSHDDSSAVHRELQNAYNFFREGLPVIYSDGYNQSSAPDFFPRIANTPYLGQFGDDKMPELARLHQKLARGGTRPRWGDANIVAFERYDYREPGSAADQTVVLFAMNDNYGYPGDTAFVDGEGETFPSGVNDPPGAGADHQGLAVGFPPGSVLVQLATAAPGFDRTYRQSIVRAATNSRAAAQASGGTLVYVGNQTIPSGGGAIEILIPSGGYVAYGLQWPETSRASLSGVFELRQNGAEVSRLAICRSDGVNGDADFNPSYPFLMRGSIDAAGNVTAGTNVGNRAYAIDIPVVTNAPLDVFIHCDASAASVSLKLDGGLDLNSQMQIGPMNPLDRRDHPPGSASDIFLGYEQTSFRFRHGPEKFAARDVVRDNAISFGAETYVYTVGGTNHVTNGAGDSANLQTSTATWVYHDPLATNTAVPPHNSATQRVPANPAMGEPVDLWVKVGYQSQIDRCWIYYTSDGSNPEGAFGVGRGTTKTVEAFWIADDSADTSIDWWKGTIPAAAQVDGAEIRYKIALYRENIDPISDSDGARRFGLYSAGITNFDPAAVIVWRHADRNSNSVETGLREGFHILRAMAFLPRTNKASVFNTFAQTFYYDPAPPTGSIAYPAADQETLTSGSYTVVVRTDASVTAVEFNILDSENINDDGITGLTNGNGFSNGAPAFVNALEVTPDTAISQTVPELAKEFRFTYANIPSSGTATITIRLRELTSDILSNHVTTLIRTVKTQAPVVELHISNPAKDGAILLLNPNDVLSVQACFTSTLTTNDPSHFRLSINGVVQPLTSGNFRPAGCGPGLRLLFWNQANWNPGTNVVSVLYSNVYVLNDTRMFVVARPGDSDGDGLSDAQEFIAGTDPFDPLSALRITGLSPADQMIVWDSVAGRNYQVLGTTNLAQPLAPISATIPANGPSTFYFDNAPDRGQKFYRVQLVP